jgi:hypothetical protein
MNLSDFLQGYGAPLAGAGAGAAVGAGLAQLGAGDIEDEKARRRSRIKRALLGAGLGGAAGAGAGVGVQALLRREEKGAPVNAGVNQALPEKPVSLYGKEVMPLGKDRALAFASPVTGDYSKAFKETLGKGKLLERAPLRPGVPTVEMASHSGGYPSNFGGGGKTAPEMVRKIKEALRCIGADPSKPFDLRSEQCNRQGGAGPAILEEAKKQGLHIARWQRPPAYAYGTLAERNPVFDVATGKPLTRSDYIKAGLLYAETPEADAVEQPPVSGGYFNREVVPGSPQTAELLDIAGKWKDPELFTKNWAAPAGYGQEADFNQRWQEMVQRYAKWLSQSKATKDVPPSGEPTKTIHPRPNVHPSREVLLKALNQPVAEEKQRGLYQLLRFWAKPKMEHQNFGRSELIRGKSDLGYGLPDDERAAVGNMLRLAKVYDQPFERRRMLESSQVAGDWLKRGLSEFTPWQLEKLRQVLPRYDQLRKTMSAEEALDKLDKEMPFVDNLIRRAIETGHILAQTGGSAQELPA